MGVLLLYSGGLHLISTSLEGVCMFSQCLGTLETDSLNSQAE